VATLLSLAANALWHSVHSYATARNQLVAIAITLIPPLGVAAALWTTPSALVGGYLTALLVVAALAAIVTLDLFSSPAVDSRALSSSVADVALPSDPSPFLAANIPLSSEIKRSVEPEQGDAEQDETELVDDVCSLDEESAETDPSILQWMTRRQSPDGAEAVEGAVRIRFEHGERVAVAHVAFVPPLAARPQAACQVLVDFAGRARIGVAQAYGLRIEARRSESDLDELSVEVGFSAETRAAQSAAA
jgi:hypothetical protein